MVSQKCPSCKKEGVFRLRWTEDGYVNHCRDCGHQYVGDNQKIEITDEINEDEEERD